ncbi:MAG: hypothetical protein PVI92_10260 [Chromatiales bacterium]
MVTCRPIKQVIDHPIDGVPLCQQANSSCFCHTDLGRKKSLSVSREVGAGRPERGDRFGTSG